MHPKVLSPEGWRVVRRLLSVGLLEGWTLCGGTGLALQLGHRVSEDLDLFRADPFDPRALAAELSRLGRLAIQRESGRTLHAVLDGLRLSFLGAEAPLLFPALPYRGLALGDPRDIAVMKLVAIGGRGSRKDFVDLYFYLRGADGLEPLFSLLRRRFQSIEYNEQHLLVSLVYFDDAEEEPMPDLLRPVAWETVKDFLVAQVRRCG